jgi:hypothetical protein
MTIDWPAAYRNVEKRVADNERACWEEREQLVARAINSRKRRNLPLDADAPAQEAIWFADRGTSYSDFVQSYYPKGWRACIFNPFRAEVSRQLGAL